MENKFLENISDKSFHYKNLEKIIFRRAFMKTNQRFFYTSFQEENCYRPFFMQVLTKKIQKKL